MSPVEDIKNLDSGYPRKRQTTFIFFKHVGTCETNLHLRFAFQSLRNGRIFEGF